MHYLDFTVDEQLLDSLTVSLVKTSVVHTDPKGQGQLQVWVSNRDDDGFDLWSKQKKQT